jgi:hypothetical protein
MGRQGSNIQTARRFQRQFTSESVTRRKSCEAVTVPEKRGTRRAKQEHTEKCRL